MAVGISPRSCRFCTAPSQAMITGYSSKVPAARLSAENFRSQPLHNHKVLSFVFIPFFIIVYSFNSASISSIDGRLPLKLSGNSLVSSYSDTPIG